MAKKVVKKTTIIEEIDAPTKTVPVDKVLKGKKALLIAEGCKLNKIKKDAEKRLKQIKNELDITVEGTYKNEANDTLVVSIADNFTDIDPMKVLAYLKRIKMAGRFTETIKVQITPLKKIVPESIIAKWRSSLDPTTKFSFK